MAMFSTKYPNNSRTVTGTPQLYNDDVILNCDTSTGAVIINLLEIPANFWNTQWRLYVIDSANNASVNNITINAGSGQTINGSSSLVVSTNSAQIVLQISSNTAFVGVESYCCASASGVTSIIAGTGITVNQPTGDVTVSAIGTGLISLTNAALLGLISAGTIVAGQEYLVTDATWTDGGIVITGTSTTSVASDGHSFHLNADYQAVGNYSGVAGFNSNLGLWSYLAAPVVGDVVIWNNLQYVSLTGVNTFDPASDPTNWSVLAKSVTNGYILEIDFSIYDKTLNRIISRQDKRNNIVEFSFTGDIYSFDNFQWGNDVVTNNKIFGTLSVPINMMNCFWQDFQNNVIQGLVHCVDDLSRKKRKSFSGNRVGSSGTVLLWGTDTLLVIQNNQIDGQVSFVQIATSNTVLFEYNFISINSNISVGQFIGTNQFLVQNNTFENDASLNIEVADTTIGNVEIKENTHFSSSITIGTFQATAQWAYNNINSKLGVITIVLLDNNATKGGEATILTNEYSNFPKVLDMSSGSVFSGGILQLGSDSWIGKYSIINGSAQTISNIQGGVFDNIELKASGTVTDSFLISYTAYGGSVNGDIIGSEGIQPLPITFTTYADYGDNIILEAIGTGKYLTKQTNVLT
tara:strand:+ start:1307 stop:3208 length:1902 start_codon:yes stop_codon:yes gene_type:complete